jgi:secondary thiamine-phosphate synthase enzyme
MAWKLTQETMTIATEGRGFHDVSARVRAVVAKSGVRTGLCTVFLQHTSASLLIQENADPAVLRDLGRWLAKIAPEDTSAYEHDAEGPDDMPSHLKTAITRASESIPIVDGKLALGTWQAIYVVEHRTAPHQRHAIVHVSGE